LQADISMPHCVSIENMIIYMFRIHLCREFVRIKFRCRNRLIYVFQYPYLPVTIYPLQFLTILFIAAITFVSDIALIPDITLVVCPFFVKFSCTPGFGKYIIRMVVILPRHIWECNKFLRILLLIIDPYTKELFIICGVDTPPYQWHNFQTEIEEPPREADRHIIF
jgi:hypothetical protein